MYECAQKHFISSDFILAHNHAVAPGHIDKLLLVLYIYTIQTMMADLLKYSKKKRTLWEDGLIGDTTVCRNLLQIQMS